MKQRVFVYHILLGIAKPLMHILYRPRIIGREHIPQSGGAVIAGNHMHAFDPVLIDCATKRVVRTLAKKALHDGKFGFIFRSAGTIPVDLHAKKNPAALQAAIEALNNGDLVNVSPEAKRNYTNELLLPFKYGAVKMSAETGAPIVPYAIAGAYKLFGNQRPTVVFGEPFTPQNDDLYAANKALYERIAALLRQITDAKILAEKHYTSFDDWSNEHAQTS